MEQFLNLVVSGAVAGALYSLIAAGLILSYSATGIFNLGFGAVAFVSAFLYYELNSGLGWPPIAAALLTIGVFAPLLGLVLDRLIFRPLAGASEAVKLMATVGLLIALPAIAKFVVEILVDTHTADIPDGNNVFIAPGVGPTPHRDWRLPGQINLNSDQAIVFGAACVLAAALWLLLRHTRLGLSMRAVVDRPELARLRGVNSHRARSTGWIFGTVLASVAGVVASPIFNSLSPATYSLVMFVAVAAAVLGGLRSIPIAFAGGLILGVVQNLVAGYAKFASGIHGFSTSVPFVLLLVGLLVLGRDRGRQAGHLAVEEPPSGLSTKRPWWWGLVAPGIGLTCIAVYVVFIGGNFWVGQTVRGLALGIVFLSFVLVTGMGGMVSLAQAAFVTSSGLTAGLLLNQFDWPFAAAVLGGVAIATALGLIVALPALRLGGLALALATLALAFVSDQVLFVWNWFRNGPAGWTIARPSWGPVHLSDDRTFGVLLVVLTGLVILGIVRLERSRWGRAIMAVRSTEIGSATVGVSPNAIKLACFAISAALAGLGGAMLATFDRGITNVSYPALLGLPWLAAVVLFGIRRPGAAVAAGVISGLLPALLNSGFQLPSVLGSVHWGGTRSTWVPDILFGLGAIQLAKNPDGFISYVVALAPRRRARPQEAAEDSPGPNRFQTEKPAVRGDASGHGPDAPLLQATGIVAGYGDVTALRDVSLSVRKGSVHVLLGANGAGKSTLCAVLSGLIMPSAGSVQFRGGDITGVEAHERARRGLVMAPESRGVFPALTVEENLAIWLARREDREVVYQRFPILGERQKSLSGNLSGGEQQMLTLAPLIVRAPMLLIADEPSLGLAPVIVDQLRDLFVEMRDHGTSLLLVEERAHQVLEIADEVTLLELGTDTWTGPRSEVNDSQLALAYFGHAEPADLGCA